ncbi:MAG: glucose-6-phosphate dehydrogenase [Candidatus Tectomicrobia bacterium]|nr:glucose-6-phosphate dehydrogenase [Candidatus Tectomicrobia bacterium]
MPEPIAPFITLPSLPDDVPGAPCAMVVFGASGDLTKRKLVPALFNLACEGLLPDGFALLGFARTPLNEEKFRGAMTESIKRYGTRQFNAAVWEKFVQRLFYQQHEYDDPASYTALKAQLQKLDRDCGTQGNHIFYLSTPPGFFPTIIENLGAAGLNLEERGKFSRVVIEKPFGRDLASAVKLNEIVYQQFQEHQVFRIDHYLGKETVQNILVFRFANGIFEPIWNRRYVDHVQITVAETIGIEGRGSYYETAGVLRDMIQNHIFHLLAYIAMEPPIDINATKVRDEEVKLLDAVQRMRPEQVPVRAVRGQYGEATVDDRWLPSYREEKGVAADSQVETFAALKLYIDNWRWAGVPFYLRSGKCLPERRAEIAIQFNRAPLQLFRHQEVKQLSPNLLEMRLQPDEGISLRFETKKPGTKIRMQTVDMQFDYTRSFDTNYSTGYETLLHDCMTGDSTLFARADMVETAWKVIQPIQEVWQNTAAEFPNYPGGTWGPIEANHLLQRDGRGWLQG